MTPKKDALLSVMPIFLILATLFSPPLMELGFSQSATICVYPSLSNVAVGQSFTVDVIVSSVNDLYAWEFKLQWDPTLLDVVDVVEGPFLKSGGLTFFSKKMNNTVGYVLVDCTLLGRIPGVSGSGTVATIQFYAEQVGTSALDLYDTILLNSLEQSIAHSVDDGTVNVTPPTHDVAINSVTLSKTVVGEGFAVSIWVAAENQGGYYETFSVTVYYNSTNLMGTQSVSLAGGSSTMVAFGWDTTGWSKTSYTISAVATPVPGETDTSDNTFIDGTVIVVMPGDVVPDHKIVDIYDMILVAAHFGHVPPENHLPDSQELTACYNADINGDTNADIYDIITVAIHFGETEP